MKDKFPLSEALTQETFNLIQRLSIEHRMIESVNERLLSYITPKLMHGDVTLFEHIVLQAIPYLHEPDSFSSENKMYKEYIHAIAKSMLLILNYTVTIKGKNKLIYWDCVSGGLSDQVRKDETFTIEYLPIEKSLCEEAKSELQIIFLGQLVTRTELSCWGVPLIGQTDALNWSKKYFQVSNRSQELHE